MKVTRAGKILGTDLEYDAPSKTYTGTATDTDPNVIAERMSPSQSVQVALRTAGQPGHEALKAYALRPE